jgi:hypothetical protein
MNYSPKALIRSLILNKVAKPLGCFENILAINTCDLKMCLVLLV